MSLEMLEKLENDVYDTLASLTEEWSGDTPTDAIARALISTARPMIEGIMEPVRAGTHGEVNGRVAQIVFAHMIATSKALQALSIAKAE